MHHITAMISTKNRYDVLPMAIQSIAMQIRKPDKFVLFDDNDSPSDLREFPVYQYLFKMLQDKGIPWAVNFGEKKGQHYNHQKIQDIAEDLIWRLDDDNVADANVLLELERHMVSGVGAVGGLVLQPGMKHIKRPEYKPLDLEQRDCQWDYWEGNPIEAEHLYSTFLYRKGITNYDLRLSTVAHREETMFTNKIFRQGLKLIITPRAITWHFRGNTGGIRTYTDKELWKHDEEIFKKWFEWKDKLIVLDNGIGDHIVFKKLMPEIKREYELAVCYPFVFPDKKCISIAQAKELVGDISDYNLYAWMKKRDWKKSLTEAYRKFYKI